MPLELPFRAGCFYDAEAIAAAFVSGGQPVSVRTVRRWVDGSPVLHGARVVAGGRWWLPGGALRAWLAGNAPGAPERDRDASTGFFVAARTEGELRRKIEEVSNA